MADSRGTITYEEFGRLFFAAAVTKERVLGTVDALAGEPIDVGPIGVGPGRVAQVTATGQIGEARASELPGEEITFAVELPVSLDFRLDLQVEKHRFHGDLLIPLTVRAHASPDLTIVIDVTPPGPRDLDLQLRADGFRAGIVRRAAGVDVEVKKFVAGYVARRLDEPTVAAARRIDVGASIDEAWSSMSPTG